MSPLRNLGPHSWEILAKAGIDSQDELRRFGAIAAYVAVPGATPASISSGLWRAP